MDEASQMNRCPKCGAAIPREAPQGLCPKCLLSEVAAPTELGKSFQSKPVPPPLDQVAAAFPKLEVSEMIGQGGMGFVFKARQAKLDRFVALKILPEALANDPAFAERFTREGRVLARLNHPNIVTVHDFGQSNGFFYLLMEFVDGVNLRQAMKVGRFTPEQALAVVPKICDALQFAHSEGILHRDIKPENILLDSKGRVKIADFGIAKILGNEKSSLAQSTGETTERNVTGIIGTPQYMAPEQIENPGQIDQRVDIYSLGVVFYEMLTGELPLGRFAPPSEKSTADPRLDEVVLRALAKEPTRRTASAGEMKTQVETIAAGTEISRSETRSPFSPQQPLAHGGFTEHLRRGVRAGSVAFLLMVAAAIATSVLLPRSYVATARIQIDSANQPTRTYDPYRMQVEFERIKSSAALRQVVRESSIAEEWAKHNNRRTTDDETLVHFLLNSLELRQSRNTSLVEIRFYSASPRLAAEVANKVAEVYCSDPARGKIIDPAAQPMRPVRPNIPLNLLLGTAAGIVLGMLTCLAVGLASFARSNRTNEKSHEAKPASNSWKLAIIASAFIVFGCISLWKMGCGVWQKSYSLDLGMLALPTGVGLMRHRPGWRKTALLFIWICFGMLFLGVAVLLGFLAGLVPKTGIFGMQVTGPSQLWIGLLYFIAFASFLIWTYHVLTHPEVKVQFQQKGFAAPWIEWTVLLGVLSAMLLISRSTISDGPIGFALQPIESVSNSNSSAVRPLTKTIELDKVTLDRSDRISVWTTSPLPPGAPVVALLRKPDGSTEEAVAQRMTIRSHAGKRTTTVFSWTMPDTVSGSNLRAVHSEMQSGFRGKPLALSQNKPFPLFTLTNDAGGTIEGSLLYTAISADEIASKKIPPSVRISSATNVPPMVLAYFTSILPPGHILEAGAIEPGGREAEVHTSVSRAEAYDNENCRWDFPKSFTSKEMKAAVEQINLRESIQLVVGGRTQLFTVTNETKGVYVGFLEVLAPTSETNK